MRWVCSIANDNFVVVSSSLAYNTTFVSGEKTIVLWVHDIQKPMEESGRGGQVLGWSILGNETRETDHTLIHNSFFNLIQLVYTCTFWFLCKENKKNRTNRKWVVKDWLWSCTCVQFDKGSYFHMVNSNNI